MHCRQSTTSDTHKINDFTVLSFTSYNNNVTMFLSIKEYTILGGDEELPLGEEFQSLVKCFINNNEKKVVKKYEWTAKLIENLQ